MTPGIIVFISVLLFVMIISLAYISWKQGRDNNKEQTKIKEATEKLAEATESLVAPLTPHSVLGNPSTVETGKGVINYQQLNLSSYAALYKPVWNMFEGLCDSSTLVTQESEIANVGRDGNLVDGNEARFKEEKVFKCKKGTVEFFIAFTTRQVKTETIINENYNPEEGEFTEVMNYCKLMLPILEGEEKAVVDSLYSTFFKEYQMAAISVKLPSKGKLARVLHITKESGQAPKVSEAQVKESSEIPAEIVNASYKAAPVVMKGVKYAPPMAVRAQALRAQLEAGKNIAIRGGTGSGKTRLLDHVTSGLPKDYSLLYLNLETLPHIVADPTLITKAQNGGKLAIAFDEAQILPPEGLSALLQIIDGNLSAEGVCFILAFSGPIDPALERRMKEVVELEQLPEAAALTLREMIKKNHPGLACDDKGYLATAKAGGFTLSDLWKHFGPKETVDQIIELYKPYAPPSPKV